jgi:hypothetical protein
MKGAVMQKRYAGIGSRKTPTMMLCLIRDIAKKMAENEFILRSGAAQGADTAFEEGANYWTWRNGKKNTNEIFLSSHATNEAIAMVKACYVELMLEHIWNNFSTYIKGLQGRNMMQILGAKLNSPVSSVICWTPDGLRTLKRLL